MAHINQIRDDSMHQFYIEINKPNRDERKILALKDSIMESTKLLVELDLGTPIISATDLWIKNTNVKIFPSRNVKDLRGYTDVSYLFIDEADYFEPSVTTELEHSITRYEEKSNCTTIMVSTPNAPGGLFQKIELDKDSKCHKIILDYTVGLGKIYDPLEIEKIHIKSLLTSLLFDSIHYEGV